MPALRNNGAEAWLCFSALPNGVPAGLRARRQLHADGDVGAAAVQQRAAGDRDGGHGQLRPPPPAGALRPRGAGCAGTGGPPRDRWEGGRILLPFTTFFS